VFLEFGSSDFQPHRKRESQHCVTGCKIASLFLAEPDHNDERVDHL
jgi:hypothetical protein